MPKKNKVTVDVAGQPTELQPEEVVMGKDGYEPKTCGHVNKQFVNHLGRLQDLVCDLLPDHAGDHHARYQRNVPNHTYDHKGSVIEESYEIEEADGYWNNSAATPVKDVKIVPVRQLSQFQKDILADFLKKDPSLSVEQALAQAQASPIWLAANA